MRKSEIIGLVLIGLLLAGASIFPMVQTKVRQKKQLKAAVEYVAEHPEAVKDSIGATADAVEAQPVAEKAAETQPLAEKTEEKAAEQTEEPAVEKIYKDSSLNMARAKAASLCKIENEKLEVVFNTKGAQPYSVRVKGYTTYRSRKDTTARKDSAGLMLIREGKSYLGIAVYAGEMINTADLTFELAEQTDSSVAMRLYFDNGGYIEQKYTLSEDS